MTENEKNHTWFKAFALAALFVAVGKCLRLRAWRMAGGPESEQWEKRWRGFPGPGGAMAWKKFHGHMPPWFHECPEPTDDDCVTSESVVEAAAAEGAA